MNETMDFNGSLNVQGQAIPLTNGSLSTSEFPRTTSPTTDSLPSETPEFKTSKLFLYFAILIFSSLGNGIVFLLISCSHRLRKASSNRLLLNLSACDFLTPLLSIPFDLVLEEHGYVWPYGAFMCRVLWPASTFTATASALTLAAISLDRFRLLMHPFTPRLTKTQITCIIISIHVSSLAIIVPYVNFLQLENQKCVERWPQLGYRQAYTIVLFMAQYAMPLVFMATVYALALIKLYNVTSNATQMRMESQNTRKSSVGTRKVSVSSRKVSVTSRKVSVNSRKVSVSSQKVSVSSQFSETNNHPSENKKGAIRKLSSRVAYTMAHGFDTESNVRVTKMFIAIVAIFTLFMLPNQVVWLWIDFGTGKDHMRLNTIKIICWLFTYTNCVCNPVIFVTFCKEFRAEILGCPRRLWKKPRPRLSISRSSGPTTEYKRSIRRSSPLTSLSTLNENEK